MVVSLRFVSYPFVAIFHLISDIVVEARQEQKEPVDLSFDTVELRILRCFHLHMEVLGSIHK